MAEIDTAALLAGVDIVRVIDGYVPLKKNNNEWEACCPFHTEATPSFKVSPAKQFYHCFGCGAHGDAITFLREFKQLSFAEACQLLGGTSPAGDTPAGPSPAARASVKNHNTSRWAPHLPVPANAPPPHVAHVMRGRPECTWCYRNLAGDVIGYVYRFRTSEGGKEVLPLSWCRHAATGAEEWRWMSFAQPRPLYGLQRLATIAADAAVLLVEGEKCADAAQAELDAIGNKTVVLAWPGGGKAVHKVDWQPLAGHTVLLWPDCDAKREPLTPTEKQAGINQHDKPLLPPDKQPGISTMQQIGTILTGLGCNVSSINIPPAGTVPDGWDVADAIAEGMIGDKLITYILQNIMPFDAASDGGTTDGATPVGEGVEAPPDIEQPPLDSYADEVPAKKKPPRSKTRALQAAPPPDEPGGDDGWRQLLLRKNDALQDCRENVYLMLKHHPAWQGVLFVDEFSLQVVRRKPAPWENAHDFKSGTEWREDDDLRLGMWLAQTERLVVRNEKNLAAAIGWYAREHQYHPVREYLDALVWDETSRTSDWLTDFMGVKKSEYTMMVARFFLIGMVARIYKPGCAMRFMPIFEGLQYRGKSTAFRILGGEWFSDTPLDLNNKDAYQLIQGKWLYEIAELDAFNRSETTRIKAFISSQEDRFRAPYDRKPRDWPRQIVFGGTTNQDEYFKDTTGNTRYWPLKVEEVDNINLEGLAQSRDQLLAEAVVLFKRGERWHPLRDEQITLFEPEQQAREIIDPWQTTIRKWLSTVTYPHVTVVDILCEGLKIEVGKIDGARQMSTRVGICMKRLGWLKKRETSGARDYYYIRPANWEAANVAAGGDDDAPF